MSSETPILDYRGTPPPTTYFEKRFDGTRTFELAAGRLHIKGSKSLRSDFELWIELAKVSPTYSILRLRHRLFFIALWILIGVLVGGFVKNNMIVMSGGIAVALLLMAVSFKKQTFYQFHYSSGGVAFDICEAGPEKARAHDFVQAALAAITAATPAQARPDAGTSDG